MDLIRAIEQENMKSELPKLRIGDFVKVHVKVIEGNRERIQVFDGTIIGMHGKGINKAFTVRKLSSGIGVERIFPIHSPKIENVEVVRHGKIRRAKLYYLRDRLGKSARLKEDLRIKD